MIRWWHSLCTRMHAAPRRQLQDAEEYRKLELQSSALRRRTHRVTFFKLALAKHVNIVFFSGLQNIFPTNLWIKQPALHLFTTLPTDQKMRSE